MFFSLKSQVIYVGIQLCFEYLHNAFFMLCWVWNNAEKEICFGTGIWIFSPQIFYICTLEFTLSESQIPSVWNPIIWMHEPFFFCLYTERQKGEMKKQWNKLCQEAYEHGKIVHFWHLKQVSYTEVLTSNTCSIIFFYPFIDLYAYLAVRHVRLLSFKTDLF